MKTFLAINFLLFSIIGFSQGIKFDKEKYDNEVKEKKEIRYTLFIKSVIVVGYTSIILYLLRNFIELIPSPFDGICGLEHVRVKEIETVTGIIFVLFFSYQFDFLEYIRDRYTRRSRETQVSPTTPS